MDQAQIEEQNELDSDIPQIEEPLLFRLMITSVREMAQNEDVKDCEVSTSAVKLILQNSDEIIFRGKILIYCRSLSPIGSKTSEYGIGSSYVESRWTTASVCVAELDLVPIEDA